MQHYLSFLLDFFRLSVWLLLLMLVFVPLERLFAQNQQKVFRKEFFIDLGYYFLNNFLPRLLLVLPLSIVAWGIHHLEPSGLYTWVGSLSIRTRLVLAIIVGEFGSYWGHRWSHEIPLLWRFHAIHHSPKEMDWLVNTRAHPLDLFFTRLCGLVPLYLLGLAQPTGKTADIVPLIYVVFATIWSFFIHANISWRFGWLEKMVATPAFHHWHHTNDGADYINKNYAAIFPWIDKIFGTFYLPKNRWPKEYGSNTPIATSFSGQLLQPLNIKGISSLFRCNGL